MYKITGPDREIQYLQQLHRAVSIAKQISLFVTKHCNSQNVKIERSANKLSFFYWIVQDINTYHDRVSMWQKG